MRRLIRLLAVWCCGALLSACAAKPQQASCGEPVAPRDGLAREVTVLGDDLSPLRSAFNGASDRWRVVALVSPTCGECVFGAEVVEREITARYAVEQVPAFIVWIPMLPPDNEGAARNSATIYPPQRARQFYDAEQAVGWGYARHTFDGYPDRARDSLPQGHWLEDLFEAHRGQVRPQWDLYMLYAPGVRWVEDDRPPMPTHWIRHFGRRDDAKTSTYWQDTIEAGPREGDLFAAMRSMVEGALGPPGSMGGPVTIEVLGFEGCPGTPKARANVERAVALIGLDARVVYVDLQKLPQDDPRRAWPAPTVLVEGRDLFGMAKPRGSAMGCRLYADGALGEHEIAAALKAAIARRVR